MQPKNDTTASPGEQTYLAGEAYQTKLDADKTQLASGGYHTVLAVQPLAVSVEAAAVEEDQEFYRIGDYIADRYEVLALHRGAWGVIYGTYDHEEELPRALKTIQKKYRFNKKLLELFTEEAALWVQLEKHPYIVRAYAVKEFEEQPFVITEYISNAQGNDLRSWLGSPKLTLAVGVELALKIAQGMQYAHNKVPGLIHRDLKPANILVDEYGQPYITDFGLVHAAGSDAGTPAYMAPEQWRKEAITIRTDIYAFGCILYEILTGHRMYSAIAIDEWRYMHLMQFPVAPCQLKPDIPAGLEEFVLRCLGKEVDRRPRDWDEMVEVLAGWCYQLTGQPPVLDFSAYKLDARELLSASASLIKLSKYPEALAVCERIFENDPEWISAFGMKAVVLYGLQRHQEALDCLNPYSDSDDFRILQLRGMILLALDRYEEALSYCEQALAINPDDQVTWETKGDSLKGLNRFGETLDCFNEALAIAPDYWPIWLKKARILTDLGEYEEALICCDKYSEAQPADSDGWNQKGIILLNLQRFDEGLDCFNRTLEVNPDHAIGWLNKGITLHILKCHHEALECFDKVISLEPGKCKAWREKADSLYELEHYREAVDCLDRALELNPEDDQIWSGKGRSLYFLESYQEAASCCDRALELNQRNGDAWYYKLRALEELVGWEQVLTHYDQALEIRPNDRELWKAKGRILDKLKRSEEALPYFDRALEIDPGFYPAWICKGMDLYDLGRYEEALISYNRALELDPENDSTWFRKGMVLDKFGRYIEAVEAFEQAAKLAPEYAGYFSGKARSLYHMGRYEEAVAGCDQALVINPENNWGLEYKGKSLIKLNRTVEGTACLKKLLEQDPDLDIWDDFSESITL